MPETDTERATCLAFCRLGNQIVIPRERGNGKVKERVLTEVDSDLTSEQLGP